MPHIFNRLINNSSWAAVTHGDRGLYEYYFAMNNDQYRYDNNWAFIRQEARLSGVRYCDGEMLVTMVSKDFSSPNLIMFAPIGNERTFEEKAVALIAEVQDLTGKQVIVRRVNAELRRSLLRSRRFEMVPPTEFTWACDIPEDVYPQVVIDTERTATLAGSLFQPIRNHLNHLQRSHTTRVDDLAGVCSMDVANLVERWAAEHTQRMIQKHQHKESQVDPTAYTAFLHYLQENDACRKQNIGKVVFIDDVLSGFAFVARTTEVCGSLFASVCLTGIRGAAELLMMAAVRATKECGLRYLNLGGAETQGLFEYKKKFGNAVLVSTCDMRLQACSAG